MATYNVSRSVYINQLRRAFLLRAHPDRFRNENKSIREAQSILLQTLSQRMNQKDFQAYIANNASNVGDSTTFYSQTKPIPFVLEKRDGSLLRQTIQLNDSVENVLHGLRKALKLSGAASLPPPPVAPQQAEGSFGPNADELLWAPDGTPQTSNIDHRFDVNSNKGKDLEAFLSTISPDQIEERRMARMDVTAAALVARELYKFQAIDGIRMGWSSDSYAILLKSLIRLHEEHSTRFHVQSFYPLRLQFYSDDSNSGFDVYGGTVHLKPAATQLQWLESLQEVTPQRLDEFHVKRQHRDENLSLIQNSLGVKISKGHSCSSSDYYYFAESLSERFHQDGILDDNINHDARALEVERLRFVVEAPGTCRRPRATNEGTILIDAQMTEHEIASAISNLSSSAKSNLAEEKENRLKCKEAISQSQWALGLQKVSRIGLVRHSEFLSSLARLIDRSTNLRGSLAGFSVGICGSGRYCHIGDDGSLVLPHDWT